MSQSVHRRRDSTVNGKSLMAWRASHGAGKRGDEATVDDWSDEEGPPDSYDNRRLRKDATLLIKGESKRVQKQLQKYLVQFIPNIYIAEAIDGQDGLVYFPVQGASNDVTSFINIVSESLLPVYVKAGDNLQYNDNGVPETSYDVMLVYHPGALLEDFLHARNHLRKKFVTIIILCIGLYFSWAAWSDIAALFYVADAIIAVVLICSGIAWVVGFSWTSYALAAWTLILMRLTRNSDAYTLLPPALDAPESVQYWGGLIFGVLASAVCGLIAQRSEATKGAKYQS